LGPGFNERFCRSQFYLAADLQLPRRNTICSGNLRPPSSNEGAGYGYTYDMHLSRLEPT